MKISLQDAGKRYNREWIFRHLNYQFLQGEHYAITGANGSGKSTLLQVIAGAVLQSEGQITYEANPGSELQDTGYGIRDEAVEFETASPDKKVNTPSPGTIHPVSRIPYQNISDPYKYLSFAAPYLELIEEMTATEFLHFHSKFKKLTAGITEILTETSLNNAADKQIRYFSSGMKQRLKLAQAFFSDTAVLLLDEPTTNLDAEGIALYHSLIEKYGKNRLVIVSSNDEQEYNFCKEVIRIGDYK